MSASEVLSFEHVLLTRVLETGDIRTVIKRKITPDHFFIPETRTAFTFLVNHYQQYGTTPSIAMFRDEFPKFELQTTSDSVTSVCDRLRSSKLYADLMEMVEEGVRLTREDSNEALKHFRAAVASMTTQHVLTRDVDITKSMMETLSEYERVKAGQGLLGIPWPWQKLNETTLGIQNQELIFFYARPKSLKTWLMILSAVHAHRCGRRALFITKEMPTDQIRRRIVCVWAGLDYSAMRSGKLTAAEEKQFKEDLEALSETSSFIVSGDDDGEHGSGVMSVSAKIQEYDPDIVFVDGVYLMHDDRGGKRGSDWQSIAHITQDLKSLSKRADIPIIGTTQANRSGERTKGSTVSEVAFGDSFAQDCDYMIRVIYDHKEKDNNEAIITLPGIREAPGCTFTVNAFIAQNMTQKFAADSQEDVDELLAGNDEGVIT